MCIGDRHHLSEPRRVTTDVGHHEVLHAPLLYFDLLRNRVLSDFVNHKASAACWACIGRVLDDVWTTVTVIGLNSRSNRSEQSPALEVKQRPRIWETRKAVL